MGANWNLNAVGEAIARAALDPSQWVAAMDVAAAETGSRGSVLFPLSGRLPHVPYSSRIAAGLEDYFANGWVDRDDRNAGIGILRRRGAVTDLDIRSPEQIARMPFYQDYLARHGMQWFCGVRLDCGDDMWCIAIQRSIAEGPFSPEEVQRLAEASQGLGSAAAMARAVGHARCEGMLEVMESAGSPIILFSRRGDVLSLNCAAERLLGADLRIVSGQLVSSDRTAGAALGEALRRLLWKAEPDTFAPPVSLPRRDGRRSILAYPMRLPMFATNPMSPAQAAVVLRDLDRAPAPVGQDLRAAFGLTPAEASIALRLAEGVSPNSIADQMSVSVATVRVHLRSIFSKTGTHRQSELVSLIDCTLPRTRESER